MIGYLKGELIDIKENYIVLEVGNIGYEIFLPSSAILLLPSRGSDLKVYTYMQVRDDGISLFGFLSQDDLDIFKLLITVNGIGPKGALGVLSGITADELRFAILAEDVKKLSTAPGIGKKTASKIILELKDKLNLETAFEQTLANESIKAEGHDISGKREEAIQALTVLGYSSTDAFKIVNQLEITPEMTSEEILKQCLKKM